MSDTTQIARASRARSKLLVTLVVAVGLLAGLWGLNHLQLGRPAQMALKADSRNQGLEFRVHYRYYLDPSTIVVDLRKAGDVAPIDLLRAVFQMSAELHERGRRADQVILARRGEAVFLMDGDDFDRLGRDFGGGENPVYLIRTFPEKLRDPSGQPAFGTWTGGMLGVLGKQMEDVNTMARQWLEASDP